MSELIHLCFRTGADADRKDYGVVICAHGRETMITVQFIPERTHDRDCTMCTCIFPQQLVMN
jgi:hypothetical protein